ncbi:MAG: FAD synthetase family protein [Puniceicoccales bacterium]|jgi:riboflavin kinase/FMN adenylyltransferase|nr:FAD synthetase family protein [Puniceicoccales bacterium]
MPKNLNETDVIKVFLNNEIYDFSPKSLFMAIGTFDGVHLGHQKLIGEVIEQATGENGIAAAYTFRPHPTVITHPANPKSMICSFGEKYKKIGRYALAHIFEQQFDEKFSEITPQDFLRFLSEKFPTLRGICVGENFKFGHNRSGNARLLAAYSEKFGIFTTIVPSIRINGELVSSSKIRKLIDEGDSAAANLMLGK